MSRKSRPNKPISRLRMEKEMAEMVKHLESKNFTSIEEANAYLQKFQGKKIGSIIKKKRTPKEKAFDLIIEAEDASTVKGIKLAKKALELDPECVDAYNYLANTAENIDDAMHLFQKGMLIGRKALGEKFFEENSGHFWGIHESRPFMRAKEGYAQTLIVKSDYDAAIREFKEMLVLNPHDNQGVRFLLAPLLLRRNYWQDYDELHKNYEDDVSAAWVYNRALYLYLKFGSVARTVAALRKAIDTNPYVVELLIGEKDFPEFPPDSYSIGSFEEAVIYIEESILAWIAHEKALDWLADFWYRHQEMD